MRFIKNKKLTGLSLLSKRKNFIIFSLFLSVFLFSYHTAHAFEIPTIEEAAVGVVSWAVNLYIYVVGAFLTAVLIPILIGITQFNEFINNPVVEIGWSLTRDVANMMFIVVLLIIAFSTMLRIQTYHYKQSLVKLIIMAVLINFSKLISGVIIDFFQVLMLTFVRGFQGALGGNVIQAFRIYDMLALAEGTGAAQGQDLNTLAIIAGLALAAAGLTVVVFTVMIMILVLLYRIIMIWLLVVLSPLAYFAYTIRPAYWSQWWSEFFQQLTTGPVIAFFLWLELKVAQDIGTGTLLKGALIQSGDTTGSTVNPFASGFAVPDVFINYLTMVALMIGGLVVSQKMASQAGGAVGNAAAKIRRFGTKAALGLAGGLTGAWAAKKLAQGLGNKTLNTMARSKKLKGALGHVGTSRLAALIPGARGLAQKSAVALDKRSKQVKAMYGGFLNALPDKTKKKIANRTKTPVFGGDRGRMMDMLRTENPELIDISKKGGEKRLRNTLKGMKYEDFTKLKPKQIKKLSGNIKDAGIYDSAKSFIDDIEKGDFGDGMKEYLQEVPVAERSIRLGFGEKVPLTPGQAAYLGAKSAQTSAPAAAAPEGGRARLAEDGEVEAELAKPESERNFGEGNMSVRALATGESNVMGVDFKDLGLDYLKDAKGRPEGVKGYTVRDKKQIAEIAEKMVGTDEEPGILDQEIAKEQAKEKPNEQRIKQLQEAKLRFARVVADPENQTEFDSLAMVNSGAVGFKGKDINRTIREEELHSMLGSTDMSEEEEEKLVDYTLQKSIDHGLNKTSDVAAMAEAIKTAGPGADRYKAVDEIISKLREDKEKYGSDRGPSKVYTAALQSMNEDADTLDNLYKQTGKPKYKKWADDTRARAEAGNIDEAIKYYQEAIDSGQADDRDKRILTGLKQEKKRRQRVLEADVSAESPLENFTDVAVAMKKSGQFDEKTLERNLADTLVKGEDGHALENLKIMVDGALRVNAEEKKYAKENNETAEIERLDKERIKLENMKNLISQEQKQRSAKPPGKLENATDVYQAMAEDDFQTGLRDDYQRKKKLFGEKIIKTPAPDAKQVALKSLATGDTGAAREVIQKAIVDNDRAIKMAQDKKEKQRLIAKGNKLKQMDEVLAKEQIHKEKVLGLDVEAKAGVKPKFDEAIKRVLSKDFKANAVPHPERVRKGGIMIPKESMPNINKLALQAMKPGAAGEEARNKLQQQIKLQIEKEKQVSQATKDKPALEKSQKRVAELNSLLEAVKKGPGAKGRGSSALVNNLGKLQDQKLLQVSPREMSNIEAAITKAITSNKASDVDGVLNYVNKAIQSQTQDKEINIKAGASPQEIKEIESKINKLKSIKTGLEKEKSVRQDLETKRQKAEVSKERKEQQRVLRQAREKELRQTASRKSDLGGSKVSSDSQTGTDISAVSGQLAEIAEALKNQHSELSAQTSLLQEMVGAAGAAQTPLSKSIIESAVKKNINKISGQIQDLKLAGSAGKGLSATQAHLLKTLNKSLRGVKKTLSSQN